MNKKENIPPNKTLNSLTIHLPDGKSVEALAGKSLLEISTAFKESYSYPIVAALVDNSLKDLSFIPEKGSQVEFIDLSHSEGLRIYNRSLTFLLIKAAEDIFPHCRVMVEHSLGKGLYCELKKDSPLTRHEVQALEARMQQLVKKNLPFVKEKFPLREAIQYFKSQRREDKVSLLKYSSEKYLDIYALETFKDHSYGQLVPSTGYLNTFALKFYRPGLILILANPKNPLKLPNYTEQPRLFEVFREAENWGEILGVNTLGTLNSLLEKGEGPDLVRIAEALHEKKIAEIADIITKSHHRLRVILVAGPSSSGKTSFVQRLRIQLLVNGLRPLLISLDDYFIDRDKTPRDENGEQNFESLEVVDLALFNTHLTALIQGEEVAMPTYNFKTGKREFKKQAVRLTEGHPLIIEGIHGLNDKLTASIPQGNKFKIYVSALTSLNIDNHNRIHTTDVRLLRRIVRDNLFRNHSPVNTIKRWPSVRRGEEKNIFCFQEEADTMFNSALIYELSVLKVFAVPLLKAVPSHLPEAIESKRLLRFLEHSLPLQPLDVPINSILREFIGESCFFKKDI